MQELSIWRLYETPNAKVFLLQNDQNKVNPTVWTKYTKMYNKSLTGDANIVFYVAEYTQ
jgi:hypothetical protein